MALCTLHGQLECRRQCLVWAAFGVQKISSCEFLVFTQLRWAMLVVKSRIQVTKMCAREPPITTRWSESFTIQRRFRMHSC
eukprot:symbB.v1.2.036130.t1/scaffold5030.1/size31649/4